MIKILHVEDDYSTHMLTKIKLLELEKDIDISWVESGEQAIKLLKENFFNCILCDFKMHQITGLSLLRHLREIEKNMTPFIFFTSQNDKKVIKEAYQLGLNDYFFKESGFDQYTKMLHSIKYHATNIKNP